MFKFLYIFQTTFLKPKGDQIQGFKKHKETQRFVSGYSGSNLKHLLAIKLNLGMSVVKTINSINHHSCTYRNNHCLTVNDDHVYVYAFDYRQLLYIYNKDLELLNTVKGQSNNPTGPFYFEPDVETIKYEKS